jgi:hypothetical protein
VNRAYFHFKIRDLAKLKCLKYFDISIKSYHLLIPGTLEDEDDEAIFKSDIDWTMYWKSLYKDVTEEDIINYETKYKGEFQLPQPPLEMILFPL